MKTAAVIAEYNPFHNGHSFQFRQIQNETNADYIIAIMSPDFVQRGEPAIFDKYSRTRAALLCGTDLVLELPVIFATGSAEAFARGAVSILNSLGVVDELCFGCENPDHSLFQTVSAILAEEPPRYKAILQAHLSAGCSWPKARELALMDLLASTENNTPGYGSHGLSAFLRQPNNILALEYCKALRQLHSSIHPCPLQREGSEYNSTELNSSGKDNYYCSAGALRKAILSSLAWQEYSYYIPQQLHELYKNLLSHPVFPDDLKPYLTNSFLLLAEDSLSSDSLMKRDALSRRMERLRYECIGKSWDGTVELLKTKQITASAVRRRLLHQILRIQPLAPADFWEHPYVRILGFRRSSAPLLHAIKKNSSLSVLTKNADAAKALHNYPEQMELLNADIKASHFYQAVLAEKYGTRFRSEYEKTPVII